MLTNSGIYKITSPSGKCYIGSAVNFKRRWRQHILELKSGKHHCRPLQSAAKKYGVDSLNFEILLLCERENLLFYEQRAIDSYTPEYNIYRTAGSPLGYKQSAEARMKMSLASKGKKKSEEHARNISIGQRGRKHSPESVEKTAASKRGKKVDPAIVEKIAAKLRGRKQDPEFVVRRTASLVGRPRPPEVKEKLSILAKERFAKKCEDKFSMRLFDD